MNGLNRTGRVSSVGSALDLCVAGSSPAAAGYIDLRQDTNSKLLSALHWEWMDVLCWLSEFSKVGWSSLAGVNANCKLTLDRYICYDSVVYRC